VSEANRRIERMAKRTRRLLIVGLLLAALIGPSVVGWVQLRVRQYRLDRQLAALAAQRRELEVRRDRLHNDPVYVEGLIRSTFKQTRPGEYVVPLDASQQAR